MVNLPKIRLNRIRKSPALPVDPSIIKLINLSLDSEPIIKPTKDGSSTLYSPRFGQLYHNPNGAVAESYYNFFETTGILEEIRQNHSFNIFETGFGTGMNLILLLDELKKVSYSGTVTYLTVEAYPIAVETVSKLQFGSDSELERYKPLLEKIFRESNPGMNQFDLGSGLTLLLHIGQFDQLFDEEVISGTFRFIFHDPFSPEVNSELWTPDVFRKLISISSTDALLSTYCAATSARAAMAVAGWFVAKNRGALGKREMTLASPDADRLAGWKLVNEKRLIDRFQNGEF